MAFTISYVYQATDKFSPTIKKISKHLDALNKKLQRSGSQLRTTESRMSSARATTRQFSNALTTANSRLQNMEGRTRAVNARLTTTSTGLRSATRQMRNLGQETRTTTARLTRASQALSSFGANVTLKVGVPIAAYGALSLKAFNTQEQALAKVRQSLKTTGGAVGLTFEQLTAEASRLQGITLFGDEDTLGQVTSTLLTFTRITGDAFLKTQGLALDMAAKFESVGLGQAAVQLGKALNDPVTGLGALTRTGITFDEKQQRVIKTLAKTGRLAEAQAIIFAALETQIGGTAEALADVGTGKLSQLSMAIGDFHEDVGKAIFETAGMKEMVISLTEWVIKLNAGLQNFVKEHPKLTKFIAIFAGILIILGPVAFALAKIIIVARILGVVLGLAFAPLSLTLLGIIAAIGLITALVLSDSKGLGTVAQGGRSRRKRIEADPTGVGTVAQGGQSTRKRIDVDPTLAATISRLGGRSRRKRIDVDPSLAAGGVKNESVITVKLVDPQNAVGSVAVKHKGGNKSDVGVNLQQ